MRRSRRESPSGPGPGGVLIPGAGIPGGTPAARAHEAVRRAPWRLGAPFLAILLLAGCAGAAASTAPKSPASTTGAASAAASGPAGSSPAAAATSTGSAAPVGTPAAAAQASAASFPLTLTDDEGTVVHLASAPQRVISLTPAVTETLFALGAGSKLVGGTDGDDYPPAAKTLPHVVVQTRVQIEQIVALHPDLVFAGGDGFTPEADIQRLRSLGIPVVVLYAPTVRGVLHDIDLTGEAVGAAPAADAMTQTMQREMDAIHAAVQAAGASPRTLYEIDATKQIFLPARNSFVAQMVTLAGGNPITSGDPAVWTISLEQLVADDPQVIVLGDADYGTTASDVLGRPGWGGMTAVRTRAIRPVDDTIVTRPGPRLVEGLAALARAIHPAVALPSFAPPDPMGPGSGGLSTSPLPATGSPAASGSPSAVPVSAAPSPAS